MFSCPKGKEEFCKPAKFAESEDPLVIKTAKKITKGSKNERQATEKIFKWVRDEYKWNLTKIIGAKALLQKKNKEALCSDKTNLFVALCRAIGIPVRYVLADCYLNTNDKELPRKSKHIYAEVFLNGKWIIADPAFGAESKKLFKQSVFGKPAWTKQENIKKMQGIPGFIFFFVNLYIKRSGFSKIVRSEIKRLNY